MNGFLVTIIAIGLVVIFCLIVWWITGFVYWCISKHDKKKWNKTIAEFPEVLEYLKVGKEQWKAYDKKSNEAIKYKKQIDELIGNLYYLPSHEVERRKEKAEEYKALYFEVEAEADKIYQLYLEAHNKVVDYCKEHKLRRWF